MFTTWRASLQVQQRAALDQKTDTIKTAGTLPPNLLRGPVKQNQRFYPNTFKLTVNGSVALRPLACPGPIDVANEWTILVPAIEVGGKLDDGLLGDAEQRRREIIADPTLRRVEIK